MARKPNAVFSKAWVIQWQFFGSDADVQLERHGIKDRVVEILNTRKDFDEIREYVENLYRLFLLSFSEKAFIENYRFSRKNRKQMFGTQVPVFTHFQSDLYRNMMQCFRDKGMNDPDYHRLWEEWKKYPSYITVGHNPALEARKIYDLKIFSNNGEEILEWDEPLASGERKHITYTRELR